MKHSIKITAVIVLMFLFAQLIGLLLINSFDNHFGEKAEAAIERGDYVPPDESVLEIVPEKVEPKTTTDVASIVGGIVIAVLIATAIFFLFLKVKVTIVLKVWFSFVVFVCLSVALALFFYPLIGKTLFTLFGRGISFAEIVAVPLAGILTFYKIGKRNIIIHNLTELFIYGGLAILFLPLLVFGLFFRT